MKRLILIVLGAAAIGILGALVTTGIPGYRTADQSVPPSPVTEEVVADEPVHSGDFLAVSVAVAATAPMEISDAERASLLRMREEEKLAHDVYVTLGDRWQLPIFANIAASERTHSDAVKVLLDRYDIPDPVTDATVGVFADDAMTALFTDLTTRGAASLTDALMVGATVEDLDIADLRTAMAVVDNADIRFVYENLMRGSRNHLRAFARQLDRQDATYTAQYLPQSEVDLILAGATEPGDGRAAGRGNNGAMRKGPTGEMRNAQ